MAKKQIDLGLTGLDELFMDDKERVESQLPKIYEIPLSEIDEFPKCALFYEQWAGSAHERETNHAATCGRKSE